MDAIAKKVVETLTSLALGELGLICNLKEDLENMKNTVGAIKAKLRDAEAKASNHGIKDWMKKLKDVLFDADDVLDDVSTEALRKKVMTGNKIAKEVKLFFSDSNQIAYARKMGHKLKEIKNRLDAICKDMIQLQLTSHPMETPVIDREERQSHSFVAEDYVIGREGEKNHLVSYLLHSNVSDGVLVIPIVGIGGLGKTALAQLVYNDKAVQNYFDPKMWVCVSEEFSVRQIAQKMLGQAAVCEIEQVQQDLRNQIRGKKFLLVLDDVWEENSELWNRLYMLLMEGAKGSLVIVTTRSHRVAEITQTKEPLVLEGLDDDKSWKLFCQVAFLGGKEPNDSELVRVGKEIVKKCVGVPLAIRIIGNILFRRNPTVNDWSYFKKTELSKIEHEDLSRQVFAVLKLSYDHLESNLKTCFAYCSLFPKDFEIKKETLIQLWIAQGFIPSYQSRSLEHVGDEYFMNLLSRSFFQDVEKGEYGDIITCKMHDLMHDLAVLMADNECLAIIKRRTENIGDRLHHLSFDSKIEPDWELPAKRLRTFMLPFEEYRGDEQKSNLSSLSSSLKCLRALDAHHEFFSRIPKSIGKLKHLRYLNLSYNLYIKKLPKSITKLHNLQTLVLSGCSNLKELPIHIHKLVSLRHLELDRCDSLTWMPQGLGKLTCLQTLTLFVLDHQSGGSARISELSKLSNMKGKLQIKGLQHLWGNTAEVRSAKLFFERQCFQELELEWVYDNDIGFEDEMILLGGKLCHTIKKLHINGFYGKSLSDSIGNLSSLQRLEIESCGGLATLPDSIGNLSSLQGLDIGLCGGLVTLPDSTGNLSSLQRLEIQRCGGLATLPDSIGNLSSLQLLEIQSCGGLAALPDSIGNLSSLQRLEIRSCGGLATLPDSIGNLSSLQELRIWSCGGLATLPDSIGNLSSLQELEIEWCGGLATLPNSIGNLSSLQRLEIFSCGGLARLPDSIRNLSSLQQL